MHINAGPEALRKHPGPVSHSGQLVCVPSSRTAYFIYSRPAGRGGWRRPGHTSRISGRQHGDTSPVTNDRLRRRPLPLPPPRQMCERRRRLFSSCFHPPPPPPRCSFLILFSLLPLSPSLYASSQCSFRPQFPFHLNPRHSN